MPSIASSPATPAARFGIRADEDGLLAAGVPGVQLTWMDAKVGDHVITPRIEKPVEVQALWLNALWLASRRFPRWRELFDRGRAAFEARF
ncbi:MAG TPA: amylo-alpha-1,6-glucosidase, partial [Vicinamibacterales bacterium]|nr:amylo-alpha-1,6-glucosidase [Vicinamibacterales bacterium]